MREQAKPGRPREFDEDVALEAIMEVFWTKGFDRASTQDLVEATGLKKGSLYAAFGAKRKMYLKSLARYDRLWIDALVKGLTEGLEPRDRIETFLQLAVSGAPNPDDMRGCFVCNAAIDQTSVDPATQAQVNVSLRRMEDALCVAVAQLCDAVPDDASVVRRARHLMTAYFGLRVLSRAGVGRDALEDAKRAALSALDDALAVEFWSRGS